MKAIIIYSTKYGFTAKTAALLKSQLGEDTRLVNLIREQAPPLDGYDTVILGGSIYYGKVQKQLTAYMNLHLNELLHKRIGLFICAGLPEPATKQHELKSAFPANLQEKAACADILGDELIFRKLSWSDKLIMRVVKGSTADQSHVEADKIHSFAQALLA